MSKYETIDVNRLAQIFAAMSNPYRLRILLRLIGECQQAEGRTDDAGVSRDAAPCVGELGRVLNIAPSTVSHHLKELRQAGLIQMDRVGQRVQCSAEQGVLAELADFFSEALES